MTQESDNAQTSGEVSITDALMAYASPLIEGTKTDAEMESTLRIAVMLWNASFLPESSRNKLRDSFAEGLGKSGDLANYTFALNLFQNMIQRRNTAFAPINVMIRDLKVTPGKKGIKLQVWSMPAVVFPDGSIATSGETAAPGAEPQDPAPAPAQQQ